LRLGGREVKVILKGYVVGPFQSNCFIVGSEKTKDAMLIDPGASGKALLDKVNELGLTVRLIVATHGHTDHVSALKEVKEATRAEFALHTDEVETLRGRG